MDAVEPRQHTAVSATSSTLWSTVKGALVGPFEGAGLGAIVGAVAVGGLAAAIAAPFVASVGTVVAIGAVAGLVGGAIPGAVAGGVIGAPVGAVKGFVNGREQVRAENVEADLLQARVAGFKAQEAAGQALQMQVAQEVMAVQPPHPQHMQQHAGGHVARLQSQGYAPVMANGAGFEQREAARQAATAQTGQMMGG